MLYVCAIFVTNINDIGKCIVLKRVLRTFPPKKSCVFYYWYHLCLSDMSQEMNCLVSLPHCSCCIPTTGSNDQRIASVENIKFGSTTKIHFATNILGCPSKSSIGVERDCWSSFISIANSICRDHLHNSGCPKSPNDESLIGCGLVNQIQ